MRLQFLLPITLLLSASCQHSENRYAHRAISQSQLSGTWRATNFSLSCIAKLANAGHLTKSENEIVLRSDGSCSAKGYLNPMRDPPSRLGSTNKYEIFDATCTWSVRTRAHQELVLADRAGHGASFFFDDSEGKLILWQYVTDPDAWQYVEFQRM